MKFPFEIGCAIFWAGLGIVAWAEDSKELHFTAKKLFVSTNEGCDVADFNRDGLLDIVAGRNWYAAPDFVGRPLRPLGEFGADYSENNGDHAYDVNGDGWIDVVAGSFIPTEIYWYENPGEPSLTYGKQWKAHLLLNTEISSNEMTWMRDLNGDGVPEFVVNSWNPKAPLMAYQFFKNEEGTFGLKKLFFGRENGHGMGFGDLDGDGREDLVLGRGWFRQPATPVEGAGWDWKPEWEYPGASCPMLVVDLNRDGRNDLIRGAGHDYGLYWMEQLAPAEGGRLQWRQHLIDESFSQAHALLWQDLNGDGQPELITGKRVRAHSGGDPGAKDTPVLYYYQWDCSKQAFTRHLISQGEVGTGLQIRAGDLNQDQRMDLVVSGKSGTYILFQQ